MFGQIRDHFAVRHRVFAPSHGRFHLVQASSSREGETKEDQWKTPISFSKLDGGGTETPGCRCSDLQMLLPLCRYVSGNHECPQILLKAISMHTSDIVPLGLSLAKLWRHDGQYERDRYWLDSRRHRCFRRLVPKNVRGILNLNVRSSREPMLNGFREHRFLVTFSIAGCMGMCLSRTTAIRFPFLTDVNSSANLRLHPHIRGRSGMHLATPFF